MVGKWEAAENQDKVTLEFTTDGNLHLSGNVKPLASAFKFAQVMQDFQVDPKSVPLTYELPEAERLEIEADLTELVDTLGESSNASPPNPKLREAAAIAVNHNELTITSDDGKPLTFKRVK